MKKRASLSLVTDGVMAEIEALEHAQAVKTATASLTASPSELGIALKKLASELRQSDVEVTEEDLQDYISKAGR